MYEIKSKTKNIYGVEFNTWQREIIDANMLEVEAGTTGYCGGDSGHGGRTYLQIKNLASTDINVNIIGSEYDCEGFEIILGGDSELSTFIEALEFALQVLKEEIISNGR